MNVESSKNREKPQGLLRDTVSVTLDLELLWYLHDVGSTYLLADCEHGELADEATLLLEDAIVYCEDNQQGSAALQLGIGELTLLLGLARQGDKDSGGRPVGLQAVRILMRARLALKRGELPITDQGDRTYLEAMKEVGEDDGQ